jgi:hypothetical protein
LGVVETSGEDLVDTLENIREAVKEAKRRIT